MFTPEDVQAILRGISASNTAWFPWSVILPVLFALTVVGLLMHCYRRPGRSSSRMLLGFLSLIYVVSGLSILAGKSEMGDSAWGGAIALWGVAALLLVDAFLHQTEVRWPEAAPLKWLSASLMVAGILLYPLVELATGFSWPGMVLFGAECPTTIFLIGLLIGSIPRVNRLLFILVSLNAIVTGFSVATAGATIDYLYGLAGLLGFAAMIAYRQPLFTRRGREKR